MKTLIFIYRSHSSKVVLLGVLKLFIFFSNNIFFIRVQAPVRWCYELVVLEKKTIHVIGCVMSLIVSPLPLQATLKREQEALNVREHESDEKLARVAEIVRTQKQRLRTSEFCGDDVAWMDGA